MYLFSIHVTNGIFFFITREVIDSGAGVQPSPKSAGHFAAAVHNI